jgi:SAM-dependent methyltransferase
MLPSNYGSAPLASLSQDRPRVLHSLANCLRRSHGLTKLVVTARCARTSLIERWLNIHTAGPPRAESAHLTRFQDLVHYEPIDYLLIHKYLKPVRTQPTDVFVDIGCGEGRPLCYFARRNLAKCIGVEIDAELAQKAQANASRLRGRKAEITVWVGDAVEADYSEGTIFWLLNPFGAQTLGAVLERIERTLVTRPRRIQLVYGNPEHEAVLRSAQWLTCTGRMTSPWFSGGDATYWTNEPGG